MKKFNVVLEETIKRETTVVVRVGNEDELNNILDELVGENSEDYISYLKRDLEVLEMIEGDLEVKEIDCNDYYPYQEAKDEDD